MHVFTLLLLDSGGGQVAEIARTFGVDWTHLGAQVISFSIVCAVLYKFAYKNVLAMLDQRRQQIAQGIANAEKIKAELERTQEQRQVVVSQAYADSGKIMDEARAAAAKVLERETQKALAAAEEIIAKAHESSAQERERMMAELKREIGRWVVQAATAITGKILTPEDQQRLAEQTAKSAAA
jgi:F-type H+-transporting ATPase subunit b